jgi:inorganic pyrophosphatase
VPVPKLRRRYARITEYSQMPEITIRQIPASGSRVIGWGGAAEARRLIEDAIAPRDRKRMKFTVRRQAVPLNH